MKSPGVVETNLDLRGLLMQLTEDKRISSESANRLLGANRTREQTAMHPLSYIGSQRLEDLARPGKVLDELSLLDWLADRSGLPSNPR